MHTLKRTAQVPYTARQMFELVNAVQDYPQFLPWCQKSHILNQSPDEMVASLEVAWKGVHKSFTTRNQLVPFKRIDITLINGPIKHLEGIWMFEELASGGCQIELCLEFELTGTFVDRLLQPIFHQVADALVNVFCKRAGECYGSSSTSH